MKRHFLWLALLIFGIGIAVMIDPLATRIAATIETRMAARLREKNALETQIAQWREDMRQAEALSRTIEAADVERYLALSDRNAFADALETLSASAGFDGFVFMLDPARSYEGEAKGFTQSLLTFEAFAPHDGAVMDFLRGLAQLPGRIEQKEIVLKRRPSMPVGAHNLHVTAKFLWIANGKAEEP